jgi:glycine/D-amino acid oxidase-like deaminating enzyme
VRVTDDAALTIYEPARAVDVVHRVPVLVVGGGPSGLAAAIAAARAGAEVSLLERFGCFGGNLTVVGVEGLAWYRHASIRRQACMPGPADGRIGRARMIVMRHVGRTPS